MIKKIKHHSFVHLLLVLILFLLSSFIFGGWDKGPLTAGFIVGISVFNLLIGLNPGDYSTFLKSASSVLNLLVVFLINLLFFYVLSCIVIWLFNLFFGNKDDREKN